jgi:hypothetical protein
MREFDLLNFFRIFKHKFKNDKGYEKNSNSNSTSASKT